MNGCLDSGTCRSFDVRHGLLVQSLLAACRACLIYEPSPGAEQEGGGEGVGAAAELTGHLSNLALGCPLSPPDGNVTRFAKSSSTRHGPHPPVTTSSSSSSSTSSSVAAGRDVLSISPHSHSHTAEMSQHRWEGKEGKEDLSLSLSFPLLSFSLSPSSPFSLFLSLSPPFFSRFPLLHLFCVCRPPSRILIHQLGSHKGFACSPAELKMEKILGRRTGRSVVSPIAQIKYQPLCLLNR